MLNQFGIQEEDIFQVAVVSTMSSGKSTFINALLGNDILPSKNEACTAKTFAILDNDKATTFNAYIERTDGTQEIISINDYSIMDKINSNTNIKEVVIEGNIQGFRNVQKATMIIDTPGVNNSQDERHGETTENFINNMKNGLIVYLMNATQLGIKDDQHLLSFIGQKIESSNGEINILFVINKADEIDFEKENFTTIMDHAKEYIIHAGFNNPQIVPVSSLAARLLKKAHSGKPLTKMEQHKFNSLYEMFEPKDFDLTTYAITDEYKDQQDFIQVGETKIEAGKLQRAIDRTGLTYAQYLIESAMLNHEIVQAPELKIKSYISKDEEIMENAYYHYAFRKDVKNPYPSKTDYLRNKILHKRRINKHD